MAKSQAQAKGAAAYGREAFSQWGDAMRYGGRAIATRLRTRGAGSDRPPLRERLDPSRTDKGGRLGDAADAALARFGKPGKLAAKVSLGSRVVERVKGAVGDGDDGAARSRDSDSPGAEVPFPIQESIDVAVPLGGTFALCSRFLDFPGYLDRVAEVEEADETHFVFVAKIGRRLRELEVEIVDERPDERIDWDCAGELAHSGVLTFHPLAPRLTRLELTIEREPQGLPERLSRRMRLAGHAIQAELHRFKAHAELRDEDFEDYVPEVSTEEPEELDEGQAEEEELEPA